MRLTTKGRYAVTAVLDLAFNGRDKIVTLNDIAARQNISVSYLEQLFLVYGKQVWFKACADLGAVTN